jgi:hypothetical protein
MARNALRAEAEFRSSGHQHGTDWRLLATSVSRLACPRCAPAVLMRSARENPGRVPNTCAGGDRMRQRRFEDQKISTESTLLDAQGVASRIKVMAAEIKGHFLPGAEAVPLDSGIGTRTVCHYSALRTRSPYESSSANHGRKFYAATQDPTDEQPQDAKPTRLTASSGLLDEAKAIAKASRRSNRRSFVDCAYHIFGRHSPKKDDDRLCPARHPPPTSFPLCMSRASSVAAAADASIADSCGNARNHGFRLA